MLNFFLLIHFLITPIKPIDIVQVQEVITQRANFYHHPMPAPEAHLLAATVLDESGPISVPLILAVIEIESKYDGKAKSKKGCKGLMQLSWGTAQTMAKRLGMSKFNLFDIKTNVKLGVYYLNALLEENGSISQALTEYNRGFKAFIAHGKRISGYTLSVLKKARAIRQLLKNDLTCSKNS